MGKAAKEQRPAASNAEVAKFEVELGERTGIRHTREVDPTLLIIANARRAWSEVLALQDVFNALEHAGYRSEAADIKDNHRKSVRAYEQFDEHCSAIVRCQSHSVSLYGVVHAFEFFVDVDVDGSTLPDRDRKTGKHIDFYRLLAEWAAPHLRRLHNEAAEARRLAWRVKDDEANVPRLG